MDQHHGRQEGRTRVTECKVDGCGNPRKARGWCGAHWSRWRKYGDPLGRGERTWYTSPEESFVGRVAWDGEHLIWTGQLRQSGHGAIAVERKMIPAHRYAWEREHGPIPDGKVIDHRCHAPACVLVEHLRLATPQQNSQNRRGATKGRDLPRGVYRSGRRYQASVRESGALHYLGTFDTVESASRAAQTERAIRFGEFAGGA